MDAKAFLQCAVQTSKTSDCLSQCHILVNIIGVFLLNVHEFHKTNVPAKGPRTLNEVMVIADDRNTTRDQGFISRSLMNQLSVLFYVVKAIFDKGPQGTTVYWRLGRKGARIVLVKKRISYPSDDLHAFCDAVPKIFTPQKSRSAAHEVFGIGLSSVRVHLLIAKTLVEKICAR